MDLRVWYWNLLARYLLVIGTGFKYTVVLEWDFLMFALLRLESYHNIVHHYTPIWFPHTTDWFQVSCCRSCESKP